MATDLERLTVLIEANTKSYERSMLRMQQQTDKAIRGASKSIGGLNNALAGATRAARGFIGAWSVTRVATGIRDIIRELADLKDTADTIGISTDRLQELQYQAEQTGADVAGMADALKVFAKRLSEAQRGKGELADLFGANFIDPKKFKDTAAALEAVIKLIGNARDEAAALDIALMAAGRGGASIFAQMFAGGPEAAKAFRDELASLNAQFTPQQIAAAAEYDDQLEKITRQLKVNIKGGIVDYIKQFNAELKFLKTFGTGSFIKYSFGGSVIDPDRVKDDAFEAGERVGEAFSEGFSNAGNEELQRALEKKATIAAGGDYTILPPDPEKISEAKGQLRELLETRYEHLKIVRDEQKAITDLIAEMERERSLIGATDEEIARSNALREAGAFATGEQREQIAALAVSMVEEQEALDDLIERMDTLRDAAGSALDSFVQSIADSKGPLEAMKAALVDVLQTIIRIAQQQAIAKLFGAFGTAGSGILSGIPGLGAAPNVSSVAPSRAAGPQSTAVHITASPSPLLVLTWDQKAMAAEERAIARGPAVARSNSQRYAIP